MVSQYLSAPLHPGALRYYKEAGLIKDDVNETMVKDKSLKYVTAK